MIDNDISDDMILSLCAGDGGFLSFMPYDIGRSRLGFQMISAAFYRSLVPFASRRFAASSHGGDILTSIC